MRVYPDRPVRLGLGFLAAVAAAAVGAVILGEYDYEGLTAVIGSALFGVAIAEVLLAIGRRLPPAGLAGLAAIVVGGLTWAAWISFNHFDRDVPLGTWASIGLGGAVAVAWAWSARSRREPRTGPPSESEGDGEDSAS